MSTTTLRVSTDIRDRVNRLRDQTHRSANDVLDEALDRYERGLFWRRYTDAAEAVAADPEATAAEASERDLWDRATADGLT